MNDAREDCKWLNDVECPYASGYEECEDCGEYEPEVHHGSCNCSDCLEHKGCAELHFKQDMGEEK